ncbi:MAG TPA: class I SAM-dependent methyltransferase [Massilibacterium sp.]|nr:class I SAM-dependent methyltransferase [Massilibacterium sp.]
MMLKQAVPFSHSLLRKVIAPGDIVVDATAGNGFDTLFLAELVGETGCVYAFDIQTQAIEQTKKRIEKANVKTDITYVLDSHAHLNQYIKEEHQQKIRAAIFNLGYLPRSDKTKITTASSTIPAIEQLLEHLLPNGLIIVVVYSGHDGGEEEKEAVLAFTKQLPQETFQVLQYGFINQRNTPPFVVAIEKRSS